MTEPRRFYWPCKTPDGWVLGERRLDPVVYYDTEKEAVEAATRLNVQPRA